LKNCAGCYRSGQIIVYVKNLQGRGARIVKEKNNWVLASMKKKTKKKKRKKKKNKEREVKEKGREKGGKRRKTR